MKIKDFQSQGNPRFPGPEPRKSSCFCGFSGPGNLKLKQNFLGNPNAKKVFLACKIPKNRRKFP